MPLRTKPGASVRCELLGCVRRYTALLWVAVLLAGAAQARDCPIGATSTTQASNEKSAGAGKAFARAEELRSEGKAQSVKESVGFYEEAIALYRASGEQRGEAGALTGLGRALDALGEKRKAIDLYNQALPLHRATNNLNGEADTLNFIALAHDQLGERQKALEHLQRALPIARQAGDRRLEGLTLNNTGLIYHNLGDKQKALDFYNQALLLHRTAGNKRAEATTLGNIGDTYNSIGDSLKALEYLNQSLSLRRAIGDPRELAVTLNNLGTVYLTVGEIQSASEYYNKALPEWRTAGDRGGEAATLHNLASIFNSTGEYQKALDLYGQALSLLKAVGNRPAEGNTLNNIGRVYSSLGDSQNAIEYYNQSLSIYRSVGNRSGEASALTNIGTVYSLSGDKQKSLEFYNQALPLRRAVGDRGGEAMTLVNVGQAYLSLNEPAKALELYNQALALQKAVGDRRGQALTLSSIGTSYVSQGEQQKALESFNQALSLARSVILRSAEAGLLYNIAQVERQRGNLAESRSAIDAALRIVESLRSKVASEELRSSYFASVQNYYALDVDVLLQMSKQNRDAELVAAALEISERGRARSLLDVLSEAGADIRAGVDPRLLERERSLQQMLNAKAARQTRLLSGRHTDEQAAAAAGEIAALTAEYRQLQGEVRATSPRYAALSGSEPVNAREIQQLLDPDSVLLEYALGDVRSHVWAVSQSAIRYYELPARAEIDAAARSFHDLVKSDAQAERVAQAATTLSQMLLAPVAADLGSKRLIMVADGALQYVPFAALPVPLSNEGRPLILDHEILSLPSASTLAMVRREIDNRQPATQTIAILADPVFGSDDSRIKSTERQPVAGSAPGATPPGNDLKRAAEESGMGGGLSFARLIGSRREAASILTLVPETTRKQAFDFEASRATATSPELGRYRVIHFATHALLDSAHPELSGIVLSLVDQQGNPQDGFLRLNEIYNLKLSADLVVLSACQTALGKEIRGEGLVGLTRGFMYAGARRVVASLWKIDDKATAELMKRFYQAMFGRDAMRPAAALRAAQIAMLKQKQWQSPYYWAGFALQGDWR